jgi:hypothetical protein
MAVCTTAIPAATPSANATALGKQSRHSHWKSGHQSIDGVASSINRLADVFSADTTVLSPARKWAAIHAIKDDGDLSDDELKVFKIIRRDTSFADTILAIRKQSAHTRFIKEELYGEADD